jgi:hypothetical protein
VYERGVTHLAALLLLARSKNTGRSPVGSSPERTRGDVLLVRPSFWEQFFLIFAHNDYECPRTLNSYETPDEFVNSFEQFGSREIWSAAEKKVARKGFDQAPRWNLATIMAKAQRLMSKVREPRIARI